HLVIFLPTFLISGMKFPALLTPSSPKHSNHVQKSKPEAFEGRDYHNERDTKIGWKKWRGREDSNP
ncbi:MAG: hypothetical protein ACPGKQ_08570, partial [bacterium]